VVGGFEELAHGVRVSMGNGGDASGQLARLGGALTTFGASGLVLSITRSAYPDPSATGSLLGLASAAKTTTFWIAGIVLLGAFGALAVAAGHRRLRQRAVTLAAGAADEPTTNEDK